MYLKKSTVQSLKNSIILDPIDLNQVENLPLKLTARMWLSSSLPSILLAIRGQRPGYP